LSDFRGYDRWLTTDRTNDHVEAEWEAYEAWCAEHGHIACEHPRDDLAWQAQCAEWNRLADESFAEYMAECNEEAF
jgi:hypothetical protein